MENNHYNVDKPQFAFLRPCYPHQSPQQEPASKHDTQVNTIAKTYTLIYIKKIFLLAVNIR